MIYTKSNGYFTSVGSTPGGRYELSPMGKNANYFCPITSNQYPNRAISQHFLDRSGIRAGGLDGSIDFSCFIDGVPSPCESIFRLVEHVGESVNGLIIFDLPAFSDLSGRTELDAVQGMLASLRAEHTDESVLISATYAGVNDSDVTVGAGQPIYKVVYDNASNDNPTNSPPCTDWIDCLKKAANQVACDRRLSRIFGDADARMSTFMEPGDLVKPDGTKRGTRIRQGTTSENPALGDAHLFANREGRGVEKVNAFTPPGRFYTEGYSGWNGAKEEGGEFQNARRVFYKPGALSQYGYDGGLIINFTYIGPTDSKGNHLLVKGGSPNEMGSVPLGIIGGYGSTNTETDRPFGPVGGGSPNGTYAHIHMIFTMWNGSVTRNGTPTWNPKDRTKRIDPRKVFCNDLGF